MYNIVVIVTVGVNFHSGENSA